MSRREARSHLNWNENRDGFVAFVADFRGHEVALLLSLYLVWRPIARQIPTAAQFLDLPPRHQT
jgi:hypothetical protein